MKKAGLQNPVLTNRNGILRLVRVGEQAHLCDARGQQTLFSRCRRNRRKEYVLTWGGLGIDSVSMSQEVSRSHSSHGQRAVRAAEVSQNDEGRNVK